MRAKFAVIFKAELKRVDEEYLQAAARLRVLAMSHYGCLDFVSTQEGAKEISISYWQSEADIQNWKNDPEPKAAQIRGAEDWYKEYAVEVVAIQRSYSSQSV